MRIVLWQRLGLLALLGFAVVYLLGQVYQMEQNKRERISAVFQSMQAKALTDNNLVDAMLELSLHEKLGRIKWDHAILTVDLRDASPNEIMNYMKELVDFSFLDHNNIHQVLIRVFNGNNENPKLLLAAETRRSDWDDYDGSVFSFDDLQSEKVRLSLTSDGQRWLANFSK